MAELKEVPCIVISFDESLNCKGSVQNFVHRRLAQISMNVPNINWKFYDSIVEDRNENSDYLDLVEIGSLNHHVVHDAFRVGVLKIGCGIGSVL